MGTDEQANGRRTLLHFSMIMRQETEKKRKTKKKKRMRERERTMSFISYY